MDATITAPTLITSAIALLTITNPIGTLPIFLSLTKDATPAKQRHMAIMIGLAVIAVLAISLAAGTFILGLFGIDMTAFKIAGNLLVASIGWAMLTAKSSPITVAPGQSPVVVPLAIPVLAGPGAIALVITFAHSYTTVLDWVAGAVTILVVGLIVGIVYFAGPTIAKLLKTTGMDILTRVFGLLLLSIALQTILSSLGEAFPGWVPAT